MPANPRGWTSWVATRSGLKILLLLCLGLGVAGSAIWNRFADRLGAPAKAELLAYQLCVGRDKGLCPKDTTFVQNVGEDSVAKFAQKECAAYRARRIIEAARGASSLRRTPDLLCAARTRNRERCG